MTDEGFHEIQLTGKQLVFLFMATTAAAVAIFLAGVQVGRGVRAAKGLDVASMPEAQAAAPAATPIAEAQTPVETTPPQPANEDLSYYTRLEGQAPAGDAMGSRGAEPARPAEMKAAAAPPSRTAAASVEPPGEGFAVQVAALRLRSEADDIITRLTTKGYAVYVLAPQPGASAAVYRVRVGKFKTRREAEQVARRLQKEERFKPWITR